MGATLMLPISESVIGQSFGLFKLSLLTQQQQR